MTCVEPGEKKTREGKKTSRDEESSHTKQHRIGGSQKRRQTNQERTGGNQTKKQSAETQKKESGFIPAMINDLKIHDLSRSDTIKRLNSLVGHIEHHRNSIAEYVRLFDYHSQMTTIEIEDVGASDDSAKANVNSGKSVISAVLNSSSILPSSSAVIS